MNAGCLQADPHRHPRRHDADARAIRQRSLPAMSRSARPSPTASSVPSRAQAGSARHDEQPDLRQRRTTSITRRSARARRRGRVTMAPDAVHTHMTNSRLTDPEILETRFPVVLEDFHIRRGSGGKGKWSAGDGTKRTIRAREKLDFAILSGHRRVAPFGIKGGEPGQSRPEPRPSQRRADRRAVGLRPYGSGGRRGLYRRHAHGRRLRQEMISQDCCGGLRAGEKSPARFAFERPFGWAPPWPGRS